MYIKVTLYNISGAFRINVSNSENAGKVSPGISPKSSAKIPGKSRVLFTVNAMLQR